MPMHIVVRCWVPVNWRWIPASAMQRLLHVHRSISHCMYVRTYHVPYQTNTRIDVRFAFWHQLFFGGYSCFPWFFGFAMYGFPVHLYLCYNISKAGSRISSQLSFGRERKHHTGAIIDCLKFSPSDSCLTRQIQNILGFQGPNDFVCKAQCTDTPWKQDEAKPIFGQQQSCNKFIPFARNS